MNLPEAQQIFDKIITSQKTMGERQKLIFGCWNRKEKYGNPFFSIKAFSKFRNAFFFF
jgi:hypothetical protein